MLYLLPPPGPAIGRKGGAPPAIGFGVLHLKQLDFDANTLALQPGHVQSPGRVLLLLLLLGRLLACIAMGGGSRAVCMLCVFCE